MRRAWVVVASRELRDTWLSGRGPALMLGYAVLVSVTTYLVAVNSELNYLEQRESVGLTLQVAVALGGLLALLGAADAISGERERATLEALLLTPASRRDLLVGKGISALSLWFAAFIVASPYVWYLGRDVDAVLPALVSGLVVGTVLALFLVGLGLAISVVSASNKTSLSVSLFVLLALFAPTQMPSRAQQGWVGELLLRVDPVASGLRFLGRLVVHESTEVSWVLSPVIAGVLGVSVALLAAGRLRLGTANRA